MSTRLDERKRTRGTLPQPIIPADYPHDSCDWPDDMVHAATPAQMKAALQRRGHKVTDDPNRMYSRARHQVLPVSVDYFTTTDNRPYSITDRARILRALKLFAFFALAGIIAYAHFVAHWL